jgi:site-specific DNA-methyltransferase (adenine-specific)
VKVHSNTGETVLDFFAGSGTTGEAAMRNGRDFILVDSNPQAVELMRKRLTQPDATAVEIGDRSSAEMSVDVQARLF